MNSTPMRRSLQGKTLRWDLIVLSWSWLAGCFGALGGASSALPELLPASCEIDLALSAAPEHLRAAASVYALEEQGFVRVVEGDGAFTCIVNRDDPRVLKPTCFDAEGAATIVPKILLFGERMMAGDPIEKIREEVESAFASGRFVSPRRPGVAYMLSRYNRPWNGTDRRLGWFPPHVMFYAPNLTNEEIGHSMAHHDPNRPLPRIGYGGPHGYMIMISDDGTRRSRSDLTDCPDWVHAD